MANRELSTAILLAVMGAETGRRWVASQRERSENKGTVWASLCKICEALERAGGYITSRYWRKIDWKAAVIARQYADEIGGVGVPVQAMAREIRAILLAAVCMDLDMKNAHVQIIMDLIERVDPLARSGKYHVLAMFADPDKREGLLRQIAEKCRLHNTDMTAEEQRSEARRWRQQ